MDLPVIKKNSQADVLYDLVMLTFITHPDRTIDDLAKYLAKLYSFDLTKVTKIVMVPHNKEKKCFKLPLCEDVSSVRRLFVNGVKYILLCSTYIVYTDKDNYNSAKWDKFVIKAQHKIISANKMCCGCRIVYQDKLRVCSRCKKEKPDKKYYYCSDLCIKHHWAVIHKWQHDGK